MRDRLALALLGSGAIAMLMLAGCSEARSGTATPTGQSTTQIGTTPEPSTSSSGSTDRYGAPKVDNPLDATKYLTQPCSAIAPHLLQSLGLPVQGKPDTEGAIGSRVPACNWRAGEDSVSVGFLKANKNGLADLYRGHSSHPEAYWEETTVESFPGVFHDGVDARSAGQCSLSVGLSDPLAMLVQESGDLSTGSCDRAKQIAAAVIQTLKG